MFNTVVIKDIYKHDRSQSYVIEDYKSNKYLLPVSDTDSKDISEYLYIKDKKAMIYYSYYADMFLIATLVVYDYDNAAVLFDMSNHNLEEWAKLESIKISKAEFDMPQSTDIEKDFYIVNATDKEVFGVKPCDGLKQVYQAEYTKIDDVFYNPIPSMAYRQIKHSLSSIYSRKPILLIVDYDKAVVLSEFFKNNRLRRMLYITSPYKNGLILHYKGY